MFLKWISNDFMEAELKEGNGNAWEVGRSSGGGGADSRKKNCRDKTQYGCNVLSHHVDKTGRAVHIMRRTREDENVREKKQSIK